MTALPAGSDPSVQAGEAGGQVPSDRALDAVGVDPAPPADDAAPVDPAGDDGTGVRAVLERSRERIATEQAHLNELIERYHDRPLLDVALRIYQRDRESAGSVVGSAVAFRLFLFFVPLTLFVVGILGFLARWIEPADLNSTAGLGGTLAAQINTAMSAPNSTRWIATIAGLFGMAWAGRSLSKVLVTASCLAWQIPVTTKASLRVIGSIIGLIAAIVLVGSAVNRNRDHYGPGAASLSFLAVTALYGIAWMALSTLLPKATRDPGALLPGALLVGVVLAVMQAVSQLYLPGKLDRASELYGALATTIVTLGWFFFLGRAMVFGLTLDAVMYERFGSISRFVFGLPLVRVLPRRSHWIRTFFDLPAVAPEHPPDRRSTP
jgi:uncharacterized BrkB/YihY/UPF0761 family membrane protein